MHTATKSRTAGAIAAIFPRLESFVREVAESRIYAGIHYRFSTDAGVALGRDVGDFVAARFLAD